MNRVLLLIFFVLVGCDRDDDEPPQCTPGAAVACACPDGRSGAQICQANGAFAPCACMGAVPGMVAPSVAQSVPMPAPVAPPGGYRFPSVNLNLPPLMQPARETPPSIPSPDAASVARGIREQINRVHNETQSRARTAARNSDRGCFDACAQEFSCRDRIAARRRQAAARLETAGDPCSVLAAARALQTTLRQSSRTESNEYMTVCAEDAIDPPELTALLSVAQMTCPNPR